MKRALVLAAVTAALAGQAQARDYISIVGSSTVYPFATVVAEQFGKTTDFKTPTIESTGSGGGLKLFCAASASNTPTSPTPRGASRRARSRSVHATA